MRWFRTRTAFIRKALERPWAKLLLAFWAFVGAWDLIIAQFLSPELAKNMPRVYDILGGMSGWLPWWGWLLIGMALIASIAIEYAFQRDRSIATIDSQENKADVNLPTWFELEIRFRELEGPLQFYRIDGQDGAAGEFWRIAGGPTNESVRRFNAIAAMASAKFFRDFPQSTKKYPELALEADPLIRWFKALKYIGDRYEQDVRAEQLNKDGSSAGFIFSGSVSHPAAASATLCLELASRPIEQVSSNGAATVDKKIEFDDLEPLSDAVMWAYERIRKMPKFSATIREHYENDPSRLRSRMAQMIFNNASPPIRIWGVYPPRISEDEIPLEDAKTFKFSDDASALIDQWNEERRYIKLRVKRGDIERRIKDLEANAVE